MPTGSQRNFLTGLYFAGGLLLVFILAAVFIKVRLAKQTEAVFSVYTNFVNATGLQAGYKVWLNGVVVGQVAGVEIQRPGSVKIMMSIDTAFRRYLHTDARAKLGSAGLMGDNLVSITQANTHAPAVQDGAEITAVQPPDYSKVMKRAIRMGSQVSTLGAEFMKISTRFSEGKGSVGRLLHNDQIGADLKSTVATAKKSIGRVKNSIKDFKK